MKVLFKNQKQKTEEKQKSNRQGTSPKPFSKNTSQEITHEHIAARAYKIWEDSGHWHGNHMEHWFQAKKELSKEKSI